MNNYIKTIFFILLALVTSIYGHAQTTSNTVYLQGSIKSIHRENIDSVWLIIEANTKIDSFLVREGKINQPITTNAKEINVSLVKENFRDFHSVVAIPDNKILPELNIRLYPVYKILLRGRVRAGNMPIEDVNVLVKHNDKVYNQQTLGCYLDSENYWNCLFLGMFKADITAENPNDSITLYFTKSGYKPYREQITFSEYDGNIIDVRLEYAEVIPDQPLNNFNLKVTPPVKFLYPGADYNGWFINISYYHHLSEKLKRIAVGLEADMISSEYTSKASFIQFPDSTTFDSTYVDFSLAPSVLVWIIKPDNRKYGTYIGNSLHYSFSTHKFNYQPFIGTRYFLDLRKSLSVELRYINHEIEYVSYNPEFTTSAVRKTFTKNEQKWAINFGIQITF